MKCSLHSLAPWPGCQPFRFMPAIHCCLFSAPLSVESDGMRKNLIPRIMYCSLLKLCCGSHMHNRCVALWKQLLVIIAGGLSLCDQVIGKSRDLGKVNAGRRVHVHVHRHSVDGCQAVAWLPAWWACRGCWEAWRQRESIYCCRSIWGQSSQDDFDH